MSEEKKKWNQELQTRRDFFKKAAKGMLPMLGAVVKVSKVIDQDRFISDMRESFEHKFAGKESVIVGNMKAVVKAMEEVEVGE